MKREELEKHCTTMRGWYFADEADSVMDDLEAKIKNLEKANAELIKRVQALEDECNKLEEQNQSLFDEAYESNGKVLELESQLRTSEELKQKWFFKMRELEADAELDQKKRLMLCNGYNKKCERVKELEAENEQLKDKK